MVRFTKPRIPLSHLRLLLATGLLLALPFIGGMRVAAAPSMNYTDHGSNTSCATYCARLNGAASTPQQVIVKQDEAEAPDPVRHADPLPPYYAQFLTISVPKTIRPRGQFNTFPLRPPDIITSLAVFRF